VDYEIRAGFIKDIIKDFPGLEKNMESQQVAKNPKGISCL